MNLATENRLEYLKRRPFNSHYIVLTGYRPRNKAVYLLFDNDSVGRARLQKDNNLLQPENADKMSETEPRKLPPEWFAARFKEDRAEEQIDLNEEIER